MAPNDSTTALRRVWLLAFALMLSPTVLDAQRGTGAIAGRIRTPDGAPAVGWRVGAMDVADSAAGALSILSLTETDMEGRYRLEVPPGRYRVFAGSLELATFYPGGVNAGGARVVNVGGNADVAGIDFNLDHQTFGFTVRGRVVLRNAAAPRQEGPPMAQITGRDVRSLSISRSVPIDPKGTFEIVGVRPGVFQIGTSYITRNRNTPQVVTVRDADVPDVEIVIPHIANVHVVISTEEGGSLPAMCLRFGSSSDFDAILIDPSGVRPSRISGSPSGISRNPLCSMAQGPAYGNVSSGTTFELQLTEGEFRVSSEPRPEGYYFKSLTAGGVDLLNGPLRITEKDTSISVAAVLARPKPVRVSGRVIRTGATPLRIRLTAAMGRKETEAVVGFDGAFSLAGVDQGVHEVRLVLPDGLVVPLEKRIVVHERDEQGIEIAMPVFREITGIASVEGGVPLPRFSLLLGKDGLDLSPFSGSGGGRISTGITDAVFHFGVIPAADGSFRFAVPEGTYSVAGLTSAWSPVRSLRHGKEDLLSSLMHVTGDNPATLHVGLAAGVGGTSRHRVTGRVVDQEPGGVVEGLRVRLTGGDWAEPLIAAARADGTFEFSDVPMTVYTADVISRHTQKPEYLEVIFRDALDAQVVLLAMREIRGRVSVAGKGVPAGFTLELHGQGGRSITVGVKPDAAGAFRVSVPADTYEFHVSGLPAGYRMASLTSGTTNLLSESMRIGADSPGPYEVQATLTKVPEASFVRLAGRVTGASGSAARSIVLTGAAASITLEAPVTDGRFELSGVPSGVYLAALVEKGRRLSLDPQVVTLESTDRTGVEFRVVDRQEPGSSRDGEDTSSVVVFYGLRPAPPPTPGGLTSNDTLVIETLRTIAASEENARRSSGRYLNLPDLIAAGSIDARFEKPVSGYLFSVTAVAGGFVAAAIPIEARAGRYGFFITDREDVRFATIDRLAPFGQAGALVKK
jgi:hypothetical protein